MKEVLKFIAAITFSSPTEMAFTVSFIHLAVSIADILTEDRYI